MLAGLTPRGITELFNILDRDSGKYTFAVSCYMLELYQDDLADLLLPASQKQQGPQKVMRRDLNGSYTYCLAQGSRGNSTQAESMQCCPRHSMH